MCTLEAVLKRKCSSFLVETEKKMSIASAVSFAVQFFCLV